MAEHNKGPMKNCRAIIFDLDDTLIPSTKIINNIIGKSLGKPALKSFEQAKKIVKARLGNEHPCSHSRLLYLKVFFELRGDFTAQKCLRFMADFEKQLYRDTRQAWDASGVRKICRKLKKSYRLLLLTNENTRTQLIKLSAIDPHAKLFESIITSEDMGAEKPHRKMFSEAFQRLKLKPKDCVIVGDNLHHDIYPALKLGCTPIHYLCSGEGENAKIQRRELFKTVRNLAELEEIFLHDS